MKRLAVVLLVIATTLVGAALPATGAPFPDSVPLPDGFYPEGIAIGRGADLYAGSLLDGAVYRVDLRTGEGEVLVEGTEGRYLAGMYFDRRSGLLWAVGADSGAGKVFAFDGQTGEAVVDEVARR